MKYRAILVILHNRAETMWGFRWIECEDGATVEARSGTENNIRHALIFDGHDFRRDVFICREQVRERDLNALPYAGNGGLELRSYWAGQLATARGALTA